jgi:hypothetical protein
MSSIIVCAGSMGSSIIRNMQNDIVVIYQFFIYNLIFIPYTPIYIAI